MVSTLAFLMLTFKREPFLCERKPERNSGALALMAYKPGAHVHPLSNFAVGQPMQSHKHFARMPVSQLPLLATTTPRPLATAALPFAAGLTLVQHGLPILLLPAFLHGPCRLYADQRACCRPLSPNRLCTAARMRLPSVLSACCSQ